MINQSSDCRVNVPAKNKHKTRIMAQAQAEASIGDGGFSRAEPLNRSRPGVQARGGHPRLCRPAKSTIYLPTVLLTFLPYFPHASHSLIPPPSVREVCVISHRQLCICAEVPLRLPVPAFITNLPLFLLRCPTSPTTSLYLPIFQLSSPQRNGKESKPLSRGQLSVGPFCDLSAANALQT